MNGALDVFFLNKWGFDSRRVLYVQASVRDHGIFNIVTLPIFQNPSDGSGAILHK